MSDLSGNKIMGAGLGTALVIALLAVGVPKFFPQAPPAKPGDLVAVAPDATTSAAAEADTPPDWGTVLKTADVAAGEAKTSACRSCHMFDASGTNNIGPGLWGVEGRKPGSHPGFSYSSAMTAFGAAHPAWDYELIYEFIKGPQADIAGTKMTYQGLKSPQDRINVIAYLHTLGSNLPIPAPNPKAAAPAAPSPGAAPAPAGAPPASGAAAPATAASTKAP